MLKTLDKPEKYWEEVRNNLPEKLLEDLTYVEGNNTWKALLQLLHQEKFSSLEGFVAYIEELSDQEIKRICLPFIGNEYQNLRKKAAQGDESAMNEMKHVTSDNPFFPRYIEFISKVDVSHLKEHLMNVMTRWYDAMISKDEEEMSRILDVDYKVKNEMLTKMTPEELVEWATGGVTYSPEPSVNHVLLIPQYIYRPWNIEADIEGTKVFYYPVANESISPNDTYTPNHFLILKHKALGDEVRLRMVKLLFESDRSLKDMTEKLDIGKSTAHHHLKILRGAKLVEVIGTKYSLKNKAINVLAKELDFYLNQ